MVVGSVVVVPFPFASPGVVGVERLGLRRFPVFFFWVCWWVGQWEGYTDARIFFILHKCMKE
jgi:hypothetical protein